MTSSYNIQEDKLTGWYNHYQSNWGNDYYCSYRSQEENVKAITNGWKLTECLYSQDGKIKERKPYTGKSIQEMEMELPGMKIVLPEMKLKNKTTFDSGAERVEEEIPRYCDIPPFVLKRIALIFNEGAQHYGVENWKKGLPWSSTYNHLMDHLMLYCTGDRTEDNLAKVVWACIAQMYYDEKGIETK